MNQDARMPWEYVDPGTAGLVVGSLWGAIAAVLASIGAFLAAWFIRPLRRLLSKLRESLRKRAGGRAMLILTAAIVIIAAGCGACLLAVCPPGQGEADMGSKVILIGIDAMDPEVVDKMISEGKLPNLKKLRDSGGYSKLGTTIPPESPVAWSAAATGANPGKYGIFDFVGRDAESYVPVLKLAEQSSGMLGTSYKSAMKGTPFWRITSGKGITTTVIRWPATFPPEKVSGRMLSGLGAVDIKGLLNSYSFYTTGDAVKEADDVGRLVKVDVTDGGIETNVSGPFVRSGKEAVEAEVPMSVKLDAGKAVIEVQGSSYEVAEGEWSEWMRAKFRADAFTEVSGVFRVRLLSAGPDFSMYATSVQMDPADPVIDITYPKGYGKELAEEIGLFYTMGMPEDTKAVTEGRIGKEVFLEQVKQIEEERERMFWHEFGRFEGGVLAFAFDAGDRLQHIFWDSPVLGNGSRLNVPKAVEDYYSGKDALIGEVMEKMEPGTSLLVFSDHGFSSFERAFCMNRWLVENGYMALKEEPPEGDPGGLFRYVDWEKTRAYSLGFASLYVNLEGREGQGIVAASGRESLVNEIIGKLEAAKDPKNGKKVFTRAYRSGEIYDGPYAEDAPDIVAGFEPGYRMSWQNAVGGLSRAVLADNEEEWKGEHLIDPSHVPGVIFANFEIAKEDPHLMDIAPTVLSLLGVEVPESMDGESLVGS